MYRGLVIDGGEEQEGGLKPNTDSGGAGGGINRDEEKLDGREEPSEGDGMKAEALSSFRYERKQNKSLVQKATRR